MDANREERWTLVVALAALMALIFLRNGWMVRACVDDAYIFLRYARNTLNGDFYAWNPGKGPADGVTAPLWLAVCVVATAAADWMRSDPVLMLRHALMISAGFWLFALYRLGRSAWPAGPRPVHGLWIGLWLLLDPAFEAAARSGMETLLAVALTALSLHLFLRLERLLDSVNKTPETGRLPWGAAAGAGLVAFACVLVRPEMGLYALGAPALLLFKHRSRSTGGGRVFGMALGVVVAAGALYALFKVVVVGSLIPWPAYIKSGGHMIYENYDTESERELHGLAFEYLRHYAPFLIALPVAIATPGLRRDTAWIWAPLMGLIVYWFSTVPIMGYMFRFYQPLLPLAVALAGQCLNRYHAPVAAVDEHTRRGPDSPLNRSLAAGLCGLIVIGLAWNFWHLYLFSVSGGEQSRRVLIGENHQAMQQIRFLEDHSDGMRIAATEVGMLGFYNPKAEIIDLSGLNDRDFSEGFDADILFARRPDVITLVHYHYRGMMGDIIGHPEFRHFEPLFPFYYRIDNVDVTHRVYVDTRSPFYGPLKATTPHE